jgi:hypothetical protein
MSLRVYYEVLNQKGSPALFTDTLANRPAFGFQGRLFISTDSGQIFEDTGTAWTLVADAGVGGGTLSSVCLNGNTTATGIVITAGGLSSTTGTFSGIVTTPQVKASTSAGLSINGNSGTQVALLGAGGSANMTLYGGLTGTSGSFTSMSVLNAGVGTVTTEFVNVSDQVQINIKSTGGATYTSNSCNIGAVSSQGFYITRGTSGGAIFDISTSGTYSYILPAANGTLALTSDLGSYLPLAGGTLTGTLNGTSAVFTGTAQGSAYRLTGMTAGNGALYWTSDRVTLANYNVGGIVSFEVNGGSEAMRITSVGRVGIGTSNPADKFCVSNSGVEGLEVGFNTGSVYMFGYNRSTSAYIPLILQQGGGNVLIGTTTDNGNKLNVSGKIYANNIVTSNVTVIINSSTPTTLNSIASGIVTIRDQSNGGGCLVLYEYTQTPIIIAQAGATVYTTGSPSATQIQIADVGGGSGGITALGGSSRNNVQLSVGTFNNS